MPTNSGYFSSEYHHYNCNSSHHLSQTVKLQNPYNKKPPALSLYIHIPVYLHFSTIQYSSILLSYPNPFLPQKQLHIYNCCPISEKSLHPDPVFPAKNLHFYTQEKVLLPLPALSSASGKISYLLYPALYHLHNLPVAA